MPIVRVLVTLVLLLATACSGDEPSSSLPGAPTVVPTEAASATPPPAPTATPVPPTSTPVPPSPTPTPIVTSTGPARVLSRGPVNARVVSLTFDAGADRGFAAEILDTLAREQVVAAFGLTGQWSERNPDLVRRIAAEGHEIINHTYDHSSFTGVSAGSALNATQRRNELERAEQIILGLTGKTTKPLFRPPYGDYDASVNRDVGALGYGFNVMWTVDSGGWQGLTPAAITAKCLNMAVPGAIYIFHVGAQSQDAAALPAIIAGLRAAGYSFAPISQFAAASAQ